MPMKSYGHEFLLAALRKLLGDGVLQLDDRICYLGSQRKEQSTSFMEMNIVKNLFETQGEETYRN
jgi:pyruvate kinase